MPRICINNLSFGYESNLVLEKINLDIDSGEYVGIVGPNGGGKTTLLKLILGILKDKSKSITVQKNTNFGYIPQRQSITGYEFPTTVTELITNSSEQLDSVKYKEILELCEIQQLEKRLLSELSGGERQKVFIAKCLVSNPDFLVLDEPTTGIDPEYKVKFWELLKKLNQESKIGIIVISHDSHEILANAKRLILIDKKIQKDTEPKHFGHFHSH